MQHAFLSCFTPSLNEPLVLILYFSLVTKKTSYVKIGYDYGGETKVFEESEDETEEEEESEESEDEKLGEIGKGYGIEDFNRLVFLEKKAKEEEKRIKEFANKEVDPAEVKMNIHGFSLFFPLKLSFLVLLFRESFKRGKEGKYQEKVEIMT